MLYTPVSTRCVRFCSPTDSFFRFSYGYRSGSLKDEGKGVPIRSQVIFNDRVGWQDGLRNHFRGHGQCVEHPLPFPAGSYLVLVPQLEGLFSPSWLEPYSRKLLVFPPNLPREGFGR